MQKMQEKMKKDESLRFPFKILEKFLDCVVVVAIIFDEIPNDFLWFYFRSVFFFEENQYLIFGISLFFRRKVTSYIGRELKNALT